MSRSYDDYGIEPLDSLCHAWHDGSQWTDKLEAALNLYKAAPQLLKDLEEATERLQQDESAAEAVARYRQTIALAKGLGTAVENPKTTQPYGISPSQESYIRLPSGNFLAFPNCDTNPEGCDYIRIVGPCGGELGYWSYEEWENDPIEVMGAIMGSARGGGNKGNESDGPQFYRFAPDCEFPEGIDVDEDE